MKFAEFSKNSIKFFAWSIVLCFALLLPLAARAQFDTATVLGTVRDSAGAVVPNATIKLKNTETNVTSTVNADSEGNYQFINVKVGSYQLSTEAEGFSTTVTENISATVNARQRVDVTLQTGAVSETITVTDTPELLETASSERGQVIAREQIVNLPLNGRAYADLALLSTGVNQSPLNVPGQSGARDASFNVNGLRSSLNNFIIDGVDNNSYGTSNQGFSNQVVQASPDALEEFKVQTNNFSAEFGRAGGAVINAAIRSGTNQYRGSVWNYLRNTALNATGFFKPTNNEKPVLIQNQFGGTFGGPIWKDKIFFFVDYEGYRRIAKQVAFAVLPTAEQRQGIFRNPTTGAILPIRNPYTGEIYLNGVPQSAITPFARRVLADLPQPNTGGANNYTSLPRSQFFNDKGDVKLDFNINDKLTAFVRGSSRKSNNFEAPTIEGFSGGNSNANVFVINEQIAGGLTYTATANSVVEFRLGVSRTKAGKRPYNLGVGDMLSNYGITGLPTDPSIAGGLNSQSVSGYAQFGRQNSNPQFQNPFVWNPRLNYTLIAGRHSLKFGYEYQRIDTEISDSHPKYGIDTYSGQFARPGLIAATPTSPAIPAPGANNLYNLADFLFGARSSYQLTDTFTPDYRQRMHFAYVQDDFQLNPNLTFNIGGRYEYATPQYEAQNRLSNFDPATNTVIVARDGSIADRALVNPDRNNFAPRLGFAWKAANRTVLRGGYGVSYIHFNRLGGENILSLNPPQVFNVTIDQTTTTTSGGATTFLPICTGNNFTGCFRPTQAGYPAGLIAPSQFNALRSRVNYTPRDNRTAYVQSFHMTVQVEVLKNLLVDVGYVGNRTSNLIILADINQARPNASLLENTPIQQRRPISNFSFIQGSLAQGEAQYDSLQLKVERRFSGGIYLLNSFTLSQAKDNAPGHLETSNGDNSRANFANLQAEYAVSGYDVPVNNTTSIVAELPFGRGRRFASNMPRILDAILGGYRLTAINRVTSGRPINVTYSPSGQYSVSSDISYRPNLVGDPYLDNPTPTNYFNKDAFAIPTDPSQPFGNTPRNYLRGPAFWQADIGLHKQFQLWNEATRLEFRAEAFNVFNRTNFGAPNANVSNSNFGTITSAFPARELQFALKLYF